jgi:hypothetical protein
MIKLQIRVTTTTSLRQGQIREEMSGGSQRQSCKLTNRNVIEGQDPQDELAQHNKILWFTGHGKWRSCAVKVHGLIWGDLSKRRFDNYGSLTEGYRERGRQPTEPYGCSNSASSGNAWRNWAEVSRSHSSQTLTVMGGTWRRAEPQRAGRSSKARQSDEPDRGSLIRRRLIAKPVLDINAIKVDCLNLFEEAPHADPHVGCCGDGEGKPPCYPIRLWFIRLNSLLGKSSLNEHFCYNP